MVNTKVPEKFQLENLILTRKSLDTTGIIKDDKDRTIYEQKQYIFTYIEYEDNIRYEYLYSLNTNNLLMITRITETPTQMEKLCFSICNHMNRDDTIKSKSISIIHYTIIKYDNNHNKIYQEVWDVDIQKYSQIAQYDDKNNLILYQEDNNIMQFEYNHDNELNSYKDNYGNIWNDNMKFPMPYECVFFQVY
tara:strand:- start:4756 stop:5331 length:576 start_codon:yes stop_codon:yes gene_type:complete